MSTTGKIEKVARALCALDSVDPDEMVQSGDVAPLHIPGGAVVMAPEMLPRWHTLAKEASRFVACFEALEPGPRN